MKIWVLFPAVAFLGTLSYQSHVRSSIAQAKDSVIINHVLDGYANEWPAEKFETDKETGIRCATDNDAQTLFIAIVSPDIPSQIKMMHEGMNLYIDIKGKKKRGRGIEFPVRSEGDNSTPDFSGSDKGNRQGVDISAIKNAYVLNMIHMRLSGFGSEDPIDQSLQTEGSVKIAFNWDSTNILHVEYAIPLTMLEEKVTSLDHKEISIGWAIGGADKNSYPPVITSVSTSVVGVPRSGVGPVAGTPRNSSIVNQPASDKTPAEISFWTRYIFHIPG